MLPRLDESREFPVHKASLGCNACGSRHTSIRICYTGAGSFPGVDILDIISPRAQREIVAITGNKGQQ